MNTHKPAPAASYSFWRAARLGFVALHLCACPAGTFQPGERAQGSSAGSASTGILPGTNGSTPKDPNGQAVAGGLNGNLVVGGSTDPNAPATPAATANKGPFVRREGSQLFLGTAPFRFAGPNIYWLAGSDKQKVREALATAQAMGANLVRANSLGTFLGKPGTLEPSLNVFDPAGFASIDYAIVTAAKYGLKLQVPLTDNYDYGGQGKYQFLRWRNLTNGNDFYTNAQVISDFKAYIKNYICHVNTLTGVRYRDEPTIAIWETGNEFGGYMFREGVPPAAFTADIASYIKSLDPNHLVMDGSDGINKEALNIPSVDIYSNHYYPPDLNLYRADEAAVVTGANKVLVIGEWDWTEQKGGAKLGEFLTALENGKNAGNSWWSLFVHDAACSAFEPHDDGYTLHWPGDNADMATRAEQLRQHAYRMRGMVAPASPKVPCPTPEP